MKSEAKDLKKKLSLAVKGLKVLASDTSWCFECDPVKYIGNILDDIERVGKEK